MKFKFYQIFYLATLFFPPIAFQTRGHGRLWCIRGKLPRSWKEMEKSGKWCGKFLFFKPLFFHSFRFSAKLGGGQRFPIHLCPRTYVSSSVNISNWSGTFITTDGPIPTHYYYLGSAICLMVHSCFEYSLSSEKMYHYRIIQKIFTSLKCCAQAIIHPSPTCLWQPLIVLPSP